MISAGLNIDRILHFVFYDKILQIYRQHWIRKFYQKTYKFNTFNSTHQYIFPKYRQFPKNVGECYTGPPPPPPTPPPPPHPTPHTHPAQHALDLDSFGSIVEQRYQNLQIHFSPFNSTWLVCSLYQISRSWKNF